MGSEASKPFRIARVVVQENMPDIKSSGSGGPGTSNYEKEHFCSVVTDANFHKEGAKYEAFLAMTPDNKHPMLFIKDKAKELTRFCPLLQIDLVYNVIKNELANEELGTRKENVVRHFPIHYNDIVRKNFLIIRNDADNEPCYFDITRSLQYIENFCKTYQERYRHYDLMCSNCRRFMMALLNEFGQNFPDRYACEELFYRSLSVIETTFS